MSEKGSRCLVAHFSIAMTEADAIAFCTGEGEGVEIRRQVVCELASILLDNIYTTHTAEKKGAN